MFGAQYDNPPMVWSVLGNCPHMTDGSVSTVTSVVCSTCQAMHNTITQPPTHNVTRIKFPHGNAVSGE